MQEREFDKFHAEELQIIQALREFLVVLPNMVRYSKITWALFIKTFREITQYLKLESGDLDILNTTSA